MLSCCLVSWSEKCAGTGKVKYYNNNKQNMQQCSVTKTKHTRSLMNVQLNNQSIKLENKIKSLVLKLNDVCVHKHEQMPHTFVVV